MICAYCETENGQAGESCSFCGAPLDKKRPKMKPFVSVEMAAQPFSELCGFHTFDLLMLLRLVRKERSKAYDLMKSSQRLSKQVSFDEGNLAFVEEEYRLYTKRMRVVEGILIDRMGYKPQRVDDKLLTSLLNKMGKTVKKEGFQ